MSIHSELRGYNLHIFSQDDVYLYFHKFYLRLFIAEKEVKFIPLTKLGKIRPSNGQIFVPQLALSPTGTFCKFFCDVENLSPSTADTPLNFTEKSRASRI